MKSQISKDKGFTIPLVTIVSLLVGATLLATSTRAWLGLQGVIRQGQARSAAQIAEAGMSQVMEDLNTNYSHLLIIDKDQWSNPPQTLGICTTASKGSPSTTGNIGSEGRFELENYTFKGNPIDGGTADVRVKGEIIKSNNSSSSTSIVEQTIRIAPKNCDSPFNQSAGEALVACKIKIGNNNVRGINANVLLVCTEDIPNKCSVNANTSLIDYSDSDKKCVISSKKNSDIDGEIYVGPTDLPPVPRIPNSLLGIAPKDIKGNETIVSGSSDEDDLLDGACSNLDNITHCLVNEITLKSKKKLTIDTSSGTPVRIYVIGDKVELKGSGSIVQIPATASAARVGLFGKPINNDPNNDQEVKLTGNSKINNMWLYFPDGKVGIKGGGNVKISCKDGDCSGGNIHGAVWAKEWDGSKSNVATITVPKNLGEGFRTYYKGYSLGTKDYVAVGTTEWNNLITDN